MLYRN